MAYKLSTIAPTRAADEYEDLFGELTYYPTGTQSNPYLGSLTSGSASGSGSGSLSGSGLTNSELIALGLGAAGVGATLYGANKQSQAIEDAAKQDAASQREQNAAMWANYLMTRGINPNGAVTGQIPTNPQAINARLPLWANANFGTGGAKTWRRKGSGGPRANTLAVRAPAQASPAETPIDIFG